MNKLKLYLISRAASVPAWLGAIGILLEIILHLGNVSTLMLAFFICLIVLPEEKIQEQFKKWEEEVKKL